jgi:hypothetical protein
MLWYYVSSGQERIPVQENRMSALAGTGVLRPTTLIWREGMDSWISAGEVKPELFLPPTAENSRTASGSATGSEDGSEAVRVPAYAGGAAVAGEQGLAQELARSLRGYAGWVEISGWLHGVAGMLCVAMGTVVGFFAWRRPLRLLDWKAQLPSFLHPALDQPWWTVGACWGLALILMFAGLQLMAGAARTRRAEKLGSPEDLRFALLSMGAFFRTTTLTLALALIVSGGVILYQRRPFSKNPATPPSSAPATTPAPATAPPRDRVTI